MILKRITAAAAPPPARGRGGADGSLAAGNPEGADHRYANLVTVRTCRDAEPGKRLVDDRTNVNALERSLLAVARSGAVVDRLVTSYGTK
jgi:hypothetical protein